MNDWILKTFDLGVGGEPLAQKVSSGLAYCTSLATCALAWLDRYVDAINSIVLIIGAICTVITVGVNWYYRRQSADRDKRGLK